MAKVDKHQLALMGKYCICTNLTFPNKNGIAQVSILGDSENFARRYAEKLAQEKTIHAGLDVLQLPVVGVDCYRHLQVLPAKQVGSIMTTHKLWVV